MQYLLPNELRLAAAQLLAIAHHPSASWAQVQQVIEGLSTLEPVVPPEGEDNAPTDDGPEADEKPAKGSAPAKTPPA